MHRDLELIAKYPWLNAYHNAYRYIEGEDCQERYKDYCLLNEMPEGWRKAFGEQICEEIAQVLEEAGWKPEDYKISQIKEKYGALHWYDEGHPAALRDVIRKYEEISEKICCKCGKPATHYTTSWISYYCFDCLPERAKAIGTYGELKK